VDVAQMLLLGVPTRYRVMCLFQHLRRGCCIQLHSS